MSALAKKDLRRRLSPSARKDELLVAAEAEIRLRGDACTVEDIVRAAGAAKGTFYVYFDSWEVLLAELRSRTFASFEERFPIPPQSALHAEWVAHIHAVAIGFIDFVLDLSGLHDVLFHSRWAQTHAIPLEESASARLADRLRRGSAAFNLLPDLIDPMAQLLFGAIHAAADAVTAGHLREPVVAALQSLLMRTLFPEEEEN